MEAYLDQFLAFTKAFTQKHPGQPVDGESYGVDGPVFLTSVLKLPEKGRLEVNTVLDTTPEEFEWQAEITINDREADEYIHMIIGRDGSLAETYAKTVLPLTPERAAEILGYLERITTS